MAVNTVEYLGNLAANTDRGPSRAIWGPCPVSEFQENPALGMYFFDDFQISGNVAASGAAVANSLGAWAVYAYQGGAVTDGTLEGGVLTIGSDGDNEGVALSGTAGSFRITTTSTLALNQRLWFEARVSRSSISSTKGDFFVGLADAGAPATGNPISTTDNTLSTTPNLIGFHSKGSGPTEWNFVYQLAAGTAVYPTGLTTLMASVAGAVMTAGQMVKLGFVFDPGAYSKVISSASTGQTAGVIARPLITVYVNGQPAAAFLTTTNVQGTAFPTGFMAPSIAVMNQTGSTPPTMSVDWLRVAQLANS